jgi:hypothetical protein
MWKGPGHALKSGTVEGRILLHAQVSVLRGLSSAHLAKAELFLAGHFLRARCLCQDTRTGEVKSPGSPHRGLPESMHDYQGPEDHRVHDASVLTLLNESRAGFRVVPLVP